MTKPEPFRAAYARLVTGIAGAAEATDILQAFASVPRENFIGPPPWKIVVPATGYVTLSCDDPLFLSQDFAVALKPDRQINNGQPSLHARCFVALQVKPGEKIVHVGAGTGYYSALLARLTGPGGSVVAFELEPELAQSATSNLKDYPNVIVENRSGTNAPLPECDVLYVSAGATAPLDVWLDALLPGGRLLFPLTAAHGFGAMLLVTRYDDASFAARFVCQAAFIPCAGARDDDLAQKLTQAFTTGGIMNFQRTGWEVQSLRRNLPPDETCWFGGPNWWLSKAAVPKM